MRLLIDISGLAYRAAHKLKLSSRGAGTNIIYGVLRSLEALLADLRPEEAIITWDAGKDARLALYPEYKGNRKRDKDFKQDFARQMGILRELLTALPVTQIWEAGVEADDLIAVLCKFMRLERVVIISSDRDLYQLVKKPLHTMLGFDGRLINTELKPSQMLTHKVLVGDPSDNIKGVLGLGEKGVRKLLDEHKTLKRIMAAAKAGKAKLGRMSYREARVVVQRNLTLMRLDGAILSEAQRSSIVKQYTRGRVHRVIDQAAVKAKFTELSFTQTLRRLNAFLIPFRQIERIKGNYGGTAHAKAKTLPDTAESAAPPKRRARIIRRVKARKHRARIVRKVVARDCEDQTPKGDRRKAKSAKRDPQDGRSGTKGALRDAVRQARDGRARRRSAAIHADAEVLQHEQIRRNSALSVLSTLHADRKWLMAQPTKTLKQFLRIVHKFEDDQTYGPSAQEALFLHELADAHGMELPEWMLTKTEVVERDAKNDVRTARNRQIFRLN